MSAKTLQFLPLFFDFTSCSLNARNDAIQIQVRSLVPLCLCCCRYLFSIARSGRHAVSKFYQVQSALQMLPETIFFYRASYTFITTYTEIVYHYGVTNLEISISIASFANYLSYLSLLYVIANIRF